MISNPNSTSQNDRLFRQVVPLLRAVPGLRMLSRHTHYAGHAEEMCTGLRREDFDVVIVVGGDGTVNEVINGLLGPVDGEYPDPALLPVVAVIPTGSANVFARALGFPADPVPAASLLADLIRGDYRRRICLGTWDSRWFAVNAGFGVDANVIAKVDRARKKGFAASPLRYLRVAANAWQKAQRTPPRIDVQARDSHGGELNLKGVPMMLASNTNPWTFLGPLPVVTNPRNSFDQGLGLFGLSDLRGIKGVASMAHLIGVGHNSWFQSWIQERTISFDDAVEVNLVCQEAQRFQSDGEYEGEFSSVRLSAVDEAIEVFAPMELSSSPADQGLWVTLRELLNLR
ncbi:Diacylglycerol kinase [Corynebacterium occultum]|uniref:Diacylglycerol kinase n=2 Tax=Corynebacterium occultum TaxID=2675219 RepID=A0A6B8WBH9_9CORY|nr:Diacylglycerol kinase [Corynebacterium occultum]